MHKNLLRYLFKIYVPGPLPQIPLFRFTKLPGDSFGCSKEITTIGGQIHVDLIFIYKYLEPIFLPATSGMMIEFCGLIPDLKQLKIWLERKKSTQTDNWSMLTNQFFITSYWTSTAFNTGQVVKYMPRKRNESGQSHREPGHPSSVFFSCPAPLRSSKSCGLRVQAAS